MDEVDNKKLYEVLKKAGHPVSLWEDTLCLWPDNITVLDSRTWPANVMGPTHTDIIVHGQGKAYCIQDVVNILAPFLEAPAQTHPLQLFVAWLARWNNAKPDDAFARGAFVKGTDAEKAAVEYGNYRGNKYSYQPCYCWVDDVSPAKLPSGTVFPPAPPPEEWPTRVVVASVKWKGNEDEDDYPWYIPNIVYPLGIFTSVERAKSRASVLYPDWEFAFQEFERDTNTGDYTVDVSTY